MTSFLRTLNFSAKHAAFMLLLLIFSVTSSAQQEHTPQGTGRESHSEQAHDYRENVEKSSGYDVPDGGLLTQPWVWTLTAAALVLLIGFIYKANTDNELDN